MRLFALAFLSLFSAAASANPETVKGLIAVNEVSAPATPQAPLTFGKPNYQGVTPASGERLCFSKAFPVGTIKKDADGKHRCHEVTILGGTAKAPVVVFWYPRTNAFGWAAPSANAVGPILGVQICRAHSGTGDKHFLGRVANGACRLEQPTSSGPITLVKPTYEVLSRVGGGA
jgi:hypothetical protein